MRAPGHHLVGELRNYSCVANPDRALSRVKFPRPPCMSSSHVLSEAIITIPLTIRIGLAMVAVVKL